VRRPRKCSSCGSTNIRFDESKGKFLDVQRIQIQDLPENLESGEPPILLEVVLREDLVKKVCPGDKIILYGIPRLDTSKGKAILGIYIEAISFDPASHDIKGIKITSEDVEKIRRLASDPNVYDRLVKSIAPSIYGYEDIKLAIALQLFGGTPTYHADGTITRGDIHILLVGDPGLAKTTLIRAVSKLAPRAVMTVGYSSTGAGVTVSLNRDKDNRWVVEAGTLILADKGVALIDEIDKMGKEDRKHFLEAMENQTITVAKAGINMTLPARCTILAGANPKYGRFDKYAPIVEQINLEPQLLSRFDLIFTLVDEPDERKDEELAKHILEEEEEAKSAEIEPDLLRKWILYARRNITRVRLPKDVNDKLVQFYVSMRKRSKEGGPIAITPRQLEALIRLTKASARVQLRSVATVEDAERAINLFRKSMEQIAIDPETGEFDVDVVYTGMPKSKREKIEVVKKIISDLEEASMDKKGAKVDDILEECGKYGIDTSEALEILRKLKQVGEIYEPRRNYFKLVRFKSV